MKKLTLILTAAAAAVAFSAACGPVDDEPTTGDGDMGGESGDGDGDGAGGQDATGGMGGDGSGGTGPTCDSEEVISGGAGGAAPMCEAPDAPEEEIEIVGVYIDQFEAPVEITTEGFSFGDGLHAFSVVNNEENYAIARNPENDEFNPCAWSVFVWYEEAGDLFYCSASYDSASECAALEVEMPDSDDLLTGCGGYEWSALEAD